MGSDEESKITVVNGYLGPDKAAKFLDTCMETIARYRRAGKLQGRKLGKEYKYRIEDLERLLKKSS